MEYTNFNTEDFLTDESFVNYCYELNDADQAYWENILLTQPELSEKIAASRELCLLLGIKVSKTEKLEAGKRLKAAIEEEIAREAEPSTARVRKLWQPWLAVAASLLLFLVAYALYNYNSTESGTTLYSHITGNNYHTIAQTNFNSRQEVTLPDGTVATLNGSSTIKLANDYNLKNRHVFLTGEAFFQVKKDHSRPFVVLTDKMATTALGTSFKVQSYASEASSSVMLATGKVKVESTRSSNIDDIKLIPGEQAVLKQGSTVIEKTNFDNQALQNWINRKLIFSNANLAGITNKFREIYGINIIVPQKVPGHILFTGEFDNHNPTEVLDAIGFTNHFTYKQNGNNITLIF